MTVLEMIEHYLRENGYDGLYNPGECACLVGDLAPCGEVGHDCMAGMRKSGCAPGCGQGCSFHVVPRDSEG